MDSSKIDGHILPSKKRKSIEQNDHPASENIDEIKHNSDSDNEGSEHNIFGSKQFLLSQDLKQKLGLTEDLSASTLDYPKLKGKKSILKKNSSVILPGSNKKASYV